ncbi:MAG: nitroreductase family protein [Clostridium sp.]
MELNKVLRQRKSIRQYKEELQITEEQLEYILFSAMTAPISMKDYESIKIAVVQNKNILQEMIDAFSGKMNPFYGAPTVIIVSTKPSLVKNIEYLNVGGMIENMLLAATDLDLGSIYLTTFLSKIENRKDLLEKLSIPNEYIPLAAVGVGYKAKEQILESDETIKNRVEVFRI